MLRLFLGLGVIGLLVVGCNPTNGGGSTPGAVTAAPTTVPGTIDISFGGSLDDTPVFGPFGNVCIGELQSQTISGTISTVLEFVRAQHVRIDITGGSYTTSFQAASGCAPDGSAITFGPIIGPTTVTFSFTYVGAYVIELNPICIGKSFLTVNTFNTTAGPSLDAQAQAAFRDQQHRDMDRRLAVAVHSAFNGGVPPVVTPRCADWVPLAPAEVGL